MVAIAESAAETPCPWLRAVDGTRAEAEAADAGDAVDATDAAAALRPAATSDDASPPLAQTAGARNVRESTSSAQCGVKRIRRRSDSCRPAIARQLRVSSDGSARELKLALLLSASAAAFFAAARPALLPSVTACSLRRSSCCRCKNSGDGSRADCRNAFTRDGEAWRGGARVDGARGGDNGVAAALADARLAVTPPELVEAGASVEPPPSAAVSDGCDLW